MAFNLFDMFPPNPKEKKICSFCFFYSGHYTSQLVDQFRFVKGGRKGFIT